MMTTSQHLIRPIQPEDNRVMAEIVVAILQEFGCVGPGYASSDPEIHNLYESYSADSSQYMVIADENNTIVGGGGYSRLKGTTESDAICELQKLYFKPELRGQGLGKQLLESLIDHAHQAGYKRMYLETVPQMKSAISLYQKSGFQYLEGPRGNTGHHACSVFMLLNL